MRRTRVTSVLLLFFPLLLNADSVQYSEAISGDIPWVEGVGYPLVLELGLGINTVSGVLTRTPEVTDIDGFHIVVAEGQQVDGIRFDYSTGFTVNNGAASYTFFLDRGDSSLASESVDFVATPRAAREFFTAQLPLGPADYTVGRQSTSIFAENIYQVGYTYTFFVSGETDPPDPPDPPEAIVIDVPPWGAQPPSIDGQLSWQEWKRANRMAIDNGFMAFMHDRERLYILIDMLADDGDDAFADGGGDQFLLYFDVDGDGVITPNLDRRYRLETRTGNLRYETFCEDCVFGFNPLEPRTYSARAEAFGCSLEDGSATFFPLRCNYHRFWELALDLHEIDLQNDKVIRMGYLVSSGDPALIENFPENLNAPADYIELSLEGPVRESVNTPLVVGTPEFEITQAVQTPQNELDLVAGKPAAVRVWSATDADRADVFVYGRKDGVDLTGSPLLQITVLSPIFDEQNSRDARRLIRPLPASWAEGGTVDFDVVVRDFDDSAAVLLQASVDFVPTRKPVFWTVPMRNTRSNGTTTIPSSDWMLQVEQALQTIAPIGEIQLVRRPIHDAQNLVTDADWSEEMRTYDQSMLLAWTMGLLFLGDPPFDLPEQVAGLINENNPGLSDPVWAGGNGRWTWSGPMATSGIFIVAHEINHNLDTDPVGTWGRHSRGCGVAGPDSSWPYGTSTAIQESGVIWMGAQFGSVAAATPDLMSYCQGLGPVKWMSPYRWQAWLDVFRTDTSPVVSSLAPATSVSVSADASVVAAPVDAFYILGRVYPDGSGHLGQVLRQPGLTHTGGNGDYAVQVRDCSGALIAERRFSPSFIDVEGEPVEFVSFDQVLAAPATACSITLGHNDDALDTRIISANSPVVNMLSPNGGETWEGEVTVEWQAGDGDGDDLLFTLLYSADGGMAWQPVATRLSGTAHSVDSSQLPGSDDARLRILVTDGANTSLDDSDAAFRVVDKPPSVTIITPADGATVGPGEPLTLRGRAVDTLGNALPDDRLLWNVDGEPVGMGSAVSVFLDEGVREIALMYMDGDVPVATDSASISIADHSGMEDPVDALPGGIDILSVDTLNAGDRFVCEIVVRSGAQGLINKSRLACHIDFDDLEDESISDCDANDDGVLAGGYRLGENGRCRTSDITLKYRHNRKGGKCKGWPGVQCEFEERAVGGVTDDVCDGVVDGLVAETCRLHISAPLAAIAAERDRQCADADDGCLGGTDEASGDYRVYAYFRSRLKRARDRAPDTDDGKRPNSVEEVLTVIVNR